MKIESVIFQEWKDIFNKSFTIQGRASRQQYMLYYLFLFYASSAFVSSIDSAVGSVGYASFLSLFLVICYFVICFAGVTLTIRRLHDLGRSGWYILLNIIPLINILLFFWLFFASSSDDTKYGALEVKENFKFFDKMLLGITVLAYISIQIAVNFF